MTNLYMRIAASEAEKTSTNLVRIRPNIHGFREGYRGLSMAASVALYRAFIWPRLVQLKATRKRRVRKAKQTLAHKVKQTYGTVSKQATPVLAGTIPWTCRQ